MLYLLIYILTRALNRTLAQLAIYSFGICRFYVNGIVIFTYVIDWNRQHCLLREEEEEEFQIYLQNQRRRTCSSRELKLKRRAFGIYRF